MSVVAPARLVVAHCYMVACQVASALMQGRNDIKICIEHPAVPAVLPVVPDGTEIVIEEDMSEGSTPNRKLLTFVAAKAIGVAGTAAVVKTAAVSKTAAAVKAAADAKVATAAVAVPLAAKAATVVAKGAIAVPIAAVKAASVAVPLAARAVVGSAVLAHAAIAKEVLDVAQEAVSHLPKVVSTTKLQRQTPSNQLHNAVSTSYIILLCAV